MKSRDTKNLILLLLVIIASSCEKEESDEIYIQDFPVIEAFLMPGDTVSVSVSHYISNYIYENQDEVDINTLEVYIICNDTSYLLQNIDSGLYTDVEYNIMVKENEYYELYFTYGTFDVSATTYVREKPQNAELSSSTIAVPTFEFGGGGIPEMPEPVEVSWENYDNSYYMVVFECIESDPDPIVEVEDGESLPERMIINEPITSNYFLIRAMSFQYFGYHNVIIYHLNNDYASLYEENGNSSLNLEELQSSIENAYGIFTGVNSDTLVIKVIESK